jgi:para-nitrobenzyl esterase
MLHLSFAGCRLLARISGTLTVAAVAVLGLWSGPSASAAALASSVPVVKTTSGAVAGAAAPNMELYLGIPYAAPPVGALRWEPPQPPAKWAGTRNATGFANHCPQNPTPFGFASATEDCLYLNVFAPSGTKAGAKLPVMVWIHGGGFTEGESNDYDPDRLVARGVIVVTLNYRLGYLGFLATAGLDAEPHTHVNYGLLDQQYALAWTQANIASFGGDPTKTTVFGQSAGGESVFAQVLSPGSAGLFGAAIVQSGAYEILALPTLASAETAGDAVAVALGCSPQDTACLRNLTVAQILAQETASGSPLGGGPSPAIDGVMIPQAPETALESGAYNHVPIVQGSNRTEFRLFTALLFDLAGGKLTPPEYPIAVAETLEAAGLGAYTQQVLAQYPLAHYKSADLAYSALTTDAVFSTQAYLTDLLLTTGTTVYAYEFSDERAPEDFLPPVSFPYAAAHGSELQFLYDSYDRTGPKLSPVEEHLAATMVGYWTAFAKIGTPNGFHLPLWTPYIGIADDMESLVPPTPSLFFDFASEHNVAFWTALFTAQNAPGRLAAKHYLTIGSARTAARTLHRNPAFRF